MNTKGMKIEAACIEAYIEEIGRLDRNDPVYAAAYKAFKAEGYDMKALENPTTNVEPTEEDWERAIPIMTDGEVSKDYIYGDYKYYKYVYEHGRYPIDPETRWRFV